MKKQHKRGSKAMGGLVARLSRRVNNNSQNYAHYEKTWVDGWAKKTH